MIIKETPWLSKRKQCLPKLPSKRLKLRKRLPTELIWEMFTSIPIMYLFGGVTPAQGNHPPSGIGVINYVFEVFRIKRHTFFAQMQQLSYNFEMSCAKRKLPNGELFIQFGFSFELLDDKYFFDFVRYIFYGRSGRIPTKSLMVTSPIDISIVNGKLCGILLDYLMQSPNPRTMKQNILAGYFFRDHFPTILKKSARVMASNGIEPIPFAGMGEFFKLMNISTKIVIGDLKILTRANEPNVYVFSFSII